MARSIAYCTIALPTFVFFVLFERALDLFMGWYSQVIYVRIDTSIGHLLLLEFINPYTVARSLLVAIILAFQAIRLQATRPRLPFLLHTLLLSLLATALHHLSLFLFSVPDWIPDTDRIKVPLLWLSIFTVLLPFSFAVKKHLKQKG